MRQKANEDPELQRLKAISDLAAIRVRIAAQRLRDRLRFEMRYNPDWQREPRVPAGQTGGGQWAGGDGGGASLSPTTRLVAANLPRDPSVYVVNLQEEERNGGHAIREHVARSQSSLIQQVEKTYKMLGRINGMTVVKMQGAEGSFLSLGDANYFVSKTLRQNPMQLEEVLNGSSNQETLEWRFGFSTGIEAYWPRLEPPAAIRKTYSVRVIVRADPTRPKGYRIVTAFPINPDPSSVRVECSRLPPFIILH